MRSVMIDRRTEEMGIPYSVLELIPYRISDAIRRVASDLGGDLCEEIRLRYLRTSTLTLSNQGTLPLDVYLDRGEMDSTVDKLCGGSLYAHGDTIKNGYISLPGGIRAGVCGRAASEKGRVIGVSEINSINIRIPHAVRTDPAVICRLLSDLKYSKGVLIYSPPGEGKTTLLRSVAEELSRSDRRGGMRVSVVDTREELEFGILGMNSTVDILSGYPKATGIEIALRTLNARVIICDEIGSEEEARAICEASNGGAALVASTHASDIGGLMAKKGIRMLHDSGVFGAYVGLRRENGWLKLTVTMRDEVGVC